jgi:hypothetical protein
MLALPSSDTTFAHFHCPMNICSSISCIADIEGYVVKLVCSLGHAYWLPGDELRRVTPYWPTSA